MTAPTIGIVPLTANLCAGGKYGAGDYHFVPLESRTNGAGGLVRVGVQAVEWSWAVMGNTEFEWWMTQYLAAPSAFELWSDDARATAVSFTAGTLHEPSHGRAVGPDLWADVRIRIDNLMPLQAR